MLSLIFGIIIRIVTNSYLNVFQKLLTQKGESSSIINFYSYLGLTIIGIIFCPAPVYSQEILINICIMGLLGALGNYFIIKALSSGELSIIAPINSYKPVVALLGGILLLNEIPNIAELFALALIILGTVFLYNNKSAFNKAILYRFLALFFSGTEAVFIKKILLVSNIESAFLYWAFSGFIFATIFALCAKKSPKISKSNIKYQAVLILMIALMQYSTNYVFSRMNVAYALALFQLSTLISVFLGASLFNEKDLKKKICATIIMLIGACILVLS